MVDLVWDMEGAYFSVKLNRKVEGPYLERDLAAENGAQPFGSMISGFLAHFYWKDAQKHWVGAPCKSSGQDGQEAIGRGWEG